MNFVYLLFFCHDRGKDQSCTNDSPPPTHAIYIFIAYDYLVNNDEQLEADDITIHVNSQKGLSFLRKYYDRKLDRIYPYLTAIIDVKDGVSNE